jgi:hypothetical protein
MEFIVSHPAKPTDRAAINTIFFTSRFLYYQKKISREYSRQGQPIPDKKA